MPLIEAPKLVSMKQKRKKEKSYRGWMDNFSTHSMSAAPNNLFGLNKQQIKRLKNLTLNEQEWELIHSFSNALPPFLDSTIVLRGQNYPTMALSFYVFRLLSHFFKSNPIDGVITTAIKESLRFLI